MDHNWSVRELFEKYGNDLSIYSEEELRALMDKNGWEQFTPCDESIHYAYLCVYGHFFRRKDRDEEPQAV